MASVILVADQGERRPRARCQFTGTDCTTLPQRMRATWPVTEFYYAYLGNILAVS